MDTFELLPSLAQGELADTSAPELVAAVFRSRASGTLWVEPEEGQEIRCFFRAGDMCGTAAFKGFQTLAHVLLANDWVDALDIDSTREEAAGKGQRHGEVLVARGLLTPDQLRTALGAQHTANLGTLLSLTHGNYDWRGWEPPPAWAREVMVDPVGCLVQALEQEQHAERRRKIIAWLGPNAARLSLDWPELLGRVTLEPLDRRAAALLALPRSLQEFVHASRLPQTRAEALLAALLLAGGAEPQPRAPAARGYAPPAHEPEPPQLEPEPDPILEVGPDAVPLQELVPDHELEPELQDDEPIPELHPEPEEDLALALALHPEPVNEGHGADPFASPQLGAPARKSAPPPRRAAVDESEAIARLDSLSLDEKTPPPAPPPEPAEEPLELDIDHGSRRSAATGGSTAPIQREEPTFDHEPGGSDQERARELRKKMLARGMRNLGSMPPPARAGMDGAVEESLREPARIDESALSDEDLRFVDEVRSRAKLAQRQDAYARLGVANTATQEQIKSAYLGLAKRFHPDRASAPGLAALQPELQSLFNVLKDAHEAIATPQLRARYDIQLKSGGAAAGGMKPTSRKEEAAMTLKMGDVLLRKRDFEQAIHKLRRSVDLDASGDALAALAWALVVDPKSTPQTREEAAGLINRALRAPGVTARTYYVAGVLWRTKDPDSAVDAFRKALEIDPQHADAALELRLIEQRRGKQAAKAGSGVLSGLLFGKRKG